MNEIYCVVSGRVQQVAFRAFAEDRAANHNLTGWVKNNPDGTVTVLAQGITDSLRAFIEDLHAGSVLSQVTGVAVSWRTRQEIYPEFSICYD